MGNQNSTNKEENNELKPKSISQILDYIATHYILTLDFKSLRKLYDKEYCDNLVILTSDIIERYFTDLEITYLAQRIKNSYHHNIIPLTQEFRVHRLKIYSNHFHPYLQSICSVELSHSLYRQE